MRVTDSSMLNIYLENLEVSRARWFELNKQVSTGKRLQRPSDGPADSSRIIKIREEVSQINQYFRNINRSRAKLGIAGEALNTMRNTISLIAERGTFGLTGTVSPENRVAIANDIRGSLEALIQLAGTTVDGNHIFSGTEVNQFPVTESSGSYVYEGDSNPVRIEIGRGNEIQVNITGEESFINPGADLINSVANLASQFESNDLDGARASLGTIQEAAKLIDSSRFRISTGLRRADEAQQFHEDRLFHLTSEVSQLEDVNMAEAISKMTQAETALAASLGAGSRLQQQNLFDFLG